jgi:hypothetical protein
MAEDMISVTMTDSTGALLGSIQIVSPPPPDIGDPSWGTNTVGPYVFMPYLEHLPPGRLTIELRNQRTCTDLQGNSLVKTVISIDENGWGQTAFSFGPISAATLRGHVIVIVGSMPSDVLACGATPTL